MKEDAKYVIDKDIPLSNGNKIKSGRIIYRSHGCIYLDGGLQSKDYADDFEHLIEYEEKNGWNYLSPVRTIEGSSII